MSGIFVYADQNAHSAQLVALAAELGRPVHAIALQETEAKQLATLPVQGVFLLQGGATRPEDHAEGIADLLRAENAALLLVGDSVRGRELAAKIAAQLDIALIAGAGEVNSNGSGFAATRIAFGGSVIVTADINSLTVLTVPAGKRPAVTASGSEATLTVRASKTDDRVSVTGIEPILKSESNVGSAKSVVGVGRGFDKQEDLQLAQELATALNAAVGCSRPIAEDRRWMPAYVGMSGSIISPQLYVAAGISGQVQHVVGIRDAKVIVAINKDDKAPIFAAADYGIVGDLYQVLPLLTQAIKAKRA